MLPSLSKAISLLRGLKDTLELEGMTVSESFVDADADGEADAKKLVINTDISISVEPHDNVGKDIFGNSFKAFTPHVAKFAAKTGHADIEKVLVRLSALGIDKIEIRKAATLAAAEVLAAPTAEIFADVRWVTKGI